MVIGSVAAGVIGLAAPASAAVPLKYLANSDMYHHRNHHAHVVKEAVPKVRISNSSALSGLHHNA
jgi:hypothetical protein